MSWTLVNDDAGVERALEAVAGASAIAVDTEFMRRNTFYPQIALLQLCADDHAWLIDPLNLKSLDSLRELMVAPDVLKVLHSCSEDLEVFNHWLGVVPAPLVDTQRAAGLLGETAGIGYRALVELVSGVLLDKGETRSNWLQRPLTESQCHYAALDVLELVPVWRELASRAHQQHRMEWVMQEGELALSQFAERDRDLSKRIKGASRLSRRELATLHLLARWREDRAIAVDKPRGWVLEDKACLALAKAMPGSIEDMTALEALPPSVLRKQGDALVGLINQSRQLADENLPSLRPAPLSSSQRALLKDLRERLKSIADSLKVAPEALLAGADLELLVRRSNGEDIVEPTRWSGWRAELVVQPILASMDLQT